MLRYVYIQMCLKIARKAFLTSILIKGVPDRFVDCNSFRLKHLLAEDVDTHPQSQLVVFFSISEILCKNNPVDTHKVLRRRLNQWHTKQRHFRQMGT